MSYSEQLRHNRAVFRRLSASDETGAPPGGGTQPEPPAQGDPPAVGGYSSSPAALSAGPDDPVPAASTAVLAFSPPGPRRQVTDTDDGVENLLQRLEERERLYPQALSEET